MSHSNHVAARARLSAIRSDAARTQAKLARLHRECSERRQRTGDDDSRVVGMLRTIERLTTELDKLNRAEASIMLALSENEHVA